MAFDSTERRAYLERLRARAMDRLAEEERAAGVAQVGFVAGGMAVSRRESLRWLGLAAVGAVPAVAALVGAEAVFAAEPMSLRSAAPQYGAPAWIAPREPYAPSPVPVARVTTSRSELGDIKVWQTVQAAMVLEKSKGDWRGLKEITAKEGYYSDSWGGGTHILLAIADPDTRVAFVMRSRQSFYVTVKGEMWGCMVSPGVFSMHRSLFRGEGGSDGLAGVIAGFTQVSDPEANRRDREGANLNLEQGLPQEFWVRNGYNGWQQNSIGIAEAKRKGDVLELTLRSENWPSDAMFTIDLNAQRLVKTKFENKEWPT